MYSREEFNALCRKGLTGWEAGLLVFEDSWLVDRSPEAGSLTDKDIETLKVGLKR